MKNRKVSILIGLLLMILPFQNCARQFSVVKNNNLLAASNNPSPNGTDTGMPTNGDGSGSLMPTPTPPVTTGPGITPTPTPCLASEVGNPTMGPSDVTTVQVLSGQGPKSGSAPSESLTIKYLASNSPANHCNQSVNVQCSVVSASGVTYINATGARTAIANNDITCSRSNNNLSSAPSSTTLTFKANDNDTTKQCFSGTATFNVSLRSAADSNKISTPQVITVNFKNNCLPEQLFNSAPNAYDQLGTAVAVDGTTAAVLAPGDDGAGTDIGAVYVYDRSGNNWALTTVLRPSNGSTGDTPNSVAIKNGVIVMGTELSGNKTGAVYIFKRSGTTWAQTSKITGVVAGGRFGKSVAIDQTQIAVGAPAENSANGAVYIFDINGTQLAKINGTLGINTAFGNAVAIEGTLLAVGAPGSTLYRDTVTGDLVIYKNSGGWSEVSSNPLRGSTAKAANGVALNSELGSAVAIANGIVMVGAPGLVVDSKKTGAAFIVGADLTSLTTLNDMSATDLGRFGTAVALGSQGVIVGASDVRNRGGAFDLFTPGSYSFVRRVSSHTGADNDQFGFAVGISGDAIVVGAKLNAEPNNSQGTVSFFNIQVP